jgi:hypothetical protein
VRGLTNDHLILGGATPVLDVVPGEVLGTFADDRAKPDARVGGDQVHQSQPGHDLELVDVQLSKENQENILTSKLKDKAEETEFSSHQSSDCLDTSTNLRVDQDEDHLEQGEPGLEPRVDAGDQVVADGRPRDLEQCAHHLHGAIEQRSDAKH